MCIRDRFYADQEFDLNEVASRLDEYSATATYISLPPLFKDKQEYEDFLSLIHISLIFLSPTSTTVSSGWNLRFAFL